MAKRKFGATLADQIADLEDPAPHDYDPEELRTEGTSGSEADTENEHVQDRQHYLTIGASKLRKRDAVDLGPQYHGSSVKRKDLDGENSGNEDSDSDPFGNSGGEGTDDFEQNEFNVSPEDAVDPGQASDLDLDNPQIGSDEEISSDDAFGDSDDEKFSSFTFGRKAKPTMPQSKASGSRSKEPNGTLAATQHDTFSTSQDDNMPLRPFETLSDGQASASAEEWDAEDDLESHATSSDTSEPSVMPKPAATDRAALRRLMASEQNAIVANLSREAMADISKGKAVLQQQGAFATLLNCRIQLQKALTAAKDIVIPSNTPSLADAQAATTVKSAQVASIALWNSLSSLRASLQTEKPTVSNGRLAPRDSTASDSRSDMLSRLQSLETSSNHIRRSVLSKWSTKTTPPSSLPSRNRFSTSSSQIPLLNILDSHLGDSNITSHLSKCYTTAVPNDTRYRLYDDTPFYTAILRDLVSQKSLSTFVPGQTLTQVSTAASPSLLPKAKKQHRANLDTKASKGRKMRYTVHEKLQNFMPREDRGAWADRQVDELFGALLGRRVEGGLGESIEDEGQAQQSEEENEGINGVSGMENGHAIGLRLFGP